MQPNLLGLSTLISEEKHSNQPHSTSVSNEWANTVCNMVSTITTMCVMCVCQGRTQWSLKYYDFRTSLVAQWWRVHLPMQETWVRSLVWEDPTCLGTTKPMSHNYWACALEPGNCNYWAHVLRALRAHALQQEKLPQWETLAPKTEKAGKATKTQGSQKQIYK